MRARPTRKLACYGSYGALLLFVGLVTHRREIVLAGSPFLIALAVAMVLMRRPDIDVATSLSSDRVVEGDQVEVEVLVRSKIRAGRLDIVISLPSELTPSSGSPIRTVRIEQGGSKSTSVRFPAPRWGSWPIGPIHLRAHDPGHFITYEMTTPTSQSLRVHPLPEALAGLIEPRRTSLSYGSYVARSLGSGVEFGEIGPFMYGDRVRDVNWQVSSRRGSLYVNRRHVEQSADVVVLLDTFSAAALTRSVRAAVTIVTGYSGARDRVGIVSFGGTLRWIEPGVGVRQLYRVLDALLSSQSIFSYAWHDLFVIPPRAIPPNALLIAISPLEDERTVASLRDLCARRIDLVVIEVSSLTSTKSQPRSIAGLSDRLWALRCEAHREMLRGAGAVVVNWSDERAVAQALLVAKGARRRARRVG